MEAIFTLCIYELAAIIAAEKLHSRPLSIIAAVTPAFAFMLYFLGK